MHGQDALLHQPFYTMDQLTSFGVCRTNWYKMNREGKIKLRKFGGKTILLRSDLEAALQANLCRAACKSAA